MFAKVFEQIFDSSIAEDYNCRRMFMDLLVLADSTGAVDMTPEAISRRTNVPVEEVVKYVKELCQPDAKSRSKLEEGKRLVPLDSNRDWGWKIVNYVHYRKIRDEAARREYFRDKQREHRIREKKGKKLPSANLKTRIDGFIYYAQSGNQIKIGYSNNPLNRIAEMKVASPDIKLLAVEKTGQDVEGERHRRFKAIHIAGEWFKADKELMDFILSLPVFDRVLTKVDNNGQVLTPPSPSSSALFWEELKRNPLYTGVEIDRELEKAKQWCRRKGRRLTQRFFENWLSKADRVLVDVPVKKKQYPKFAPDLTDEQIAKNKAVIATEKAKLLEKFKMPV